MSVEAEAAEMLVRLTMDGTEKMIRFSGTMAQMSGKVFIYVCALLSNNKAKDIAMNPGGMVTATIPKEKVREFAKVAKNYNLPYFVARDPHHEQGLEDICVRAEDAAVVNRIIEKLEVSMVAQSKVKSVKDFKSFDQAAEMKKEPGITFDQALNRTVEKDFSKDTPRFVCERERPDRYIELLSRFEDYNGEQYTKTKYTVYQDGERIGVYHDGRFEGRSRNYWNETKNQMRKAGDFSDDVVFFDEKEDFDHYRNLYAVGTEKAPTPQELKASLEKELGTYTLPGGEANENPIHALTEGRQNRSGHGVNVGTRTEKAGNKSIRGFVEQYKKDQAASPPVKVQERVKALTAGRGPD